MDGNKAMTDLTKLCERLTAASHDERLSTGALYAEAAAAIESLLARVEAMRPYLQHTEWCGTPAYGQALVSNSIAHGNRLPVGGQGSCVTYNHERICTCGLDAAINQGL